MRENFISSILIIALNNTTDQNERRQSFTIMCQLAFARCPEMPFLKFAAVVTRAHFADGHVPISTFNHIDDEVVVSPSHERHTIKQP